jgi:hypothetical protein
MFLYVNILRMMVKGTFEQWFRSRATAYCLIALALKANTSFKSSRAVQ